MDKDLESYINKITEPKSELSGHAICPYLKKYLSSVKYGYAYDEQTIVLNNISIVEKMQDDLGSTFVWIIKWDIDYDELHYLRQRQQRLYLKKDIEFLYIGKGQKNPPLQGVKYSYETDSLLVLQRRSTLLQARKELAKTTNYYDFWKSPNKT